MLRGKVSEMERSFTTAIHRATGEREIQAFPGPQWNPARRAPSLHPNGQQAAPELTEMAHPAPPTSGTVLACRGWFPVRTPASQAAGARHRRLREQVKSRGQWVNSRGVLCDALHGAVPVPGRPLRGSSPSSRSVLARAMYKERMRFLWMRGLNWERAAWGMFADPRLFLGRKTPIQGRGDRHLHNLDTISKISKSCSGMTG